MKRHAKGQQKPTEQSVSTAQLQLPTVSCEADFLPHYQAGDSVEASSDAIAILRSETALSRFPLHRLTKGKDVRIELKGQATAVLWRVNHNSGYGQPGALAYKIDTLFINRRIEELGRPVPKTIRLGSLREIAEEIGSGTNTTPVKQAILQNATASITAKISYRARGGGERWLEAVFNRYSVVFTGEKLPGGEEADAVYLVLNDIYQEVLDNAVFRPLDYDYMKSLPPIAQRFYEIVSYQIYAALRHNNPRAKLLYSDYCLLSTAMRYFDFDHVKKQMYKALRSHVQSGYLARVEYERIVNEHGEADWFMHFTPGPNAGREFAAFTGAGQTRKPKSPRAPKPQRIGKDSLQLPFPKAAENGGEQPPSTEQHQNPSSAPTETNPAPLEPADATLVERLVAAQLNRSDAERFARQCPDVCLRQLDYLPYVEEFKISQGAYLRRAIEGDYGPPGGYSRAHAARKRALANDHRQAKETSRQAEGDARQSHRERFYGAFCAHVIQTVDGLETALPAASAAFGKEEEKTRDTLANGPFAGRPLTVKSLQEFDLPVARAERFLAFVRGATRRFPELSHLPHLDFWKWDEAANTTPFRF